MVLYADQVWIKDLQIILKQCKSQNQILFQAAQTWPPIQRPQIEFLKKLFPSAHLVLVIPYLLNLLSEEQLIFLNENGTSLP